MVTSTALEIAIQCLDRPLNARVRAGVRCVCRHAVTSITTPASPVKLTIRDRIESCRLTRRDLRMMVISSAVG
jgi:hypothetical protein